MNRSILLVICDFLLLSVLALVKFDAPEEDDLTNPQEEQFAAGISDDMTELFRLALEEEALQRAALQADLASRAEALESTAEALANRSEELSLTTEELQQIRAEREALAAEKAELAAQRETLAQNFASAQSALESTSADLESQRAQAAQLQSELRARQEALAAAEENLSSLEAQTAALAAEKSELSTTLRIAETERGMLQQNLLAARAEVETARVERQQAEARAETLSSNVSALAQQSGAIREEIRRQQPINVNEIFSRYAANRLPLRLTARVDAFIGTREEQATLDAVIVESEGRIFALFESGLTPLRLETLNRVRSASASFRVNGERYAILEVNLLRADPRILSVELPRSLLEGSGLTPFQITEEPLRFPEVVLVSNAQSDFGEAPFKLEPGDEGYLTVPNRLLGRVIGNDFRAARGDYIFAKTGDLMGVMLDDARGAIVRDLTIRERLPLGERFSNERATELRDRYAPPPDRRP